MTTAIREDNHGVTAMVAVALQDWTDRELLAACIQKDNGAWIELMRRYDSSLRGVVYKQLASCIDRLPSDHRDDIMGAFYLKLVDHDMHALRCFDFEKGKALFKWFAFVIAQCATDYLVDALGRPEYEPLDAAVEVPEEGGVLRSGRGRLRGSLSERVRKEKAREAAAEEKRLREEQRPCRRRAKARRKRS